MNYNKRLVRLQQFNNTNVTTDSGMTVEMKTFYDNALIKLAEANLVHDQFADKRPIPANGGKTIEFRKYDSLGKALTPLSEGVTPNGQKLTVTEIHATVDQYGGYVELSDVLKLTAIDNNITQALEKIGSQAGSTLDTITRDVIAGGSSVNYANGAASRKTLTANDTLKPIDIFRAVADLEAQNAPKIDGGYVAIIHPYVAFDLMTSNEWVSIHQYAAPENIYQGEIGKIGNVRFVQSTEAKIWKDDTCPTDLAVFGTVVLGSGAYATTSVEGGGLQTIVKPLGAGDDPLNQRSTVGWKAMKVSKRLVEQYMVRIESCSAYSAKAKAN